MTTADLVNLVVSRLDSMESSQLEFRDEVRRDISEIKQLARITNGRVTQLERKSIEHQARLAERQQVDRELAKEREHEQAQRDKRQAPFVQILVSVCAGVMLAGALAALNHFGVI